MAIVFIVNILVIALAVIIHYEFLYRITVLMPRLKIRHRFRIVLGVFLALTAHAAEVWVFAISCCDRPNALESAAGFAMLTTGQLNCRQRANQIRCGGFWTRSDPDPVFLM